MLLAPCPLSEFPSARSRVLDGQLSSPAVEAGVSNILRASTCAPKRQQLFPPLLAARSSSPTCCVAAALADIAMQCVYCGAVALCDASGALGERHGMVVLAVREWDVTAVRGACQVG